MYEAFFRRAGSRGRWRHARIYGSVRYLVEKRVEDAARATKMEYIVKHAGRLVATFTPAGEKVFVKREDGAAGC